MPSNCISRWFLTISTNVTVSIVLIFTIVVVAFLFFIGLISISQKLFISIIVTIAAIVLNVILTIFSSITYFRYPIGANEQMQKSIFNIKKKYLLFVDTLFIIVLGAISFCIYSFRNDFLNFAGLIFDDYYNNKNSNKSSEKFVNYIENYFKCKNFNLDSPSGNCAELMNEFINSKSKLLAIVVGVVSIILLILLIVGLYLDSRSKSDNVSNDRSESANFDIHEELNPNVATDF